MMRRAEFRRHMRALAAQLAWFAGHASWNLEVKPRNFQFPSDQAVRARHASARRVDDWFITPCIRPDEVAQSSIDTPILEARLTASRSAIGDAQ
jgi:hypothetical protein